MLHNRFTWHYNVRIALPQPRFHGLGCFHCWSRPELLFLNLQAVSLQLTNEQERQWYLVAGRTNSLSLFVYISLTGSIGTQRITWQSYSPAEPTPEQPTPATYAHARVNSTPGFPHMIRMTQPTSWSATRSFIRPGQTSRHLGYTY